MTTDSKALFLGLTGPQRFAILKEREKALAVAREQACRTTYRSNADKPVPAPLVQWAKNVRRDQSNLIAHLIRYIDNGAEREMVSETWDGLNQMVDAVYKYARTRIPHPRTALADWVIWRTANANIRRWERRERWTTRLGGSSCSCP